MLCFHFWKQTLKKVFLASLKKNEYPYSLNDPCIYKVIGGAYVLILK